MLNELIFFEVRIFRMFCEKLQVSSADTNKLFETYGVEMLKINGVKLEEEVCNKLEAVTDKSKRTEQERFCADLILTDAIMDMSDAEGISWQETRYKILNSEAYKALYDFETGLWETGPDYFRDFYQRIV